MKSVAKLCLCSCFCICLQRAASVTPVEPVDDQYAVLDESESEGIGQTVLIVNNF
jgi:hypothetical protein